MKKIANKIILIGTICILISGSCNQRNNFDDGIYHVDIRSSISRDPEVFNLSDIGSGISYIPLETNESCLLYQIEKIKLTNDHIFITDGMSLFQFTSSGNFVRQIGRTGKGPGEHGRRITFDVDDEQQEIFIYSSSVVNFYDLGNGTYKRRFLVNHDVSDLNIFPQGKMIFFTYELSAESLIGSVCEVFLTDSAGTIYDSILNYDRLNIESHSRGYSTTYEFAPHEIHYMYNYGDTLYKITEDFKRSPHAVFNLENIISRNNLHFEPVHDKVQFPDFLWIPEILENAHIIFITAEKGRSFIVNPNVHYIIFDKTSGTLISTHKMKNDIDGGLAFWPRFASGEKLISHYLPTEIMNHYKATSGNNEFSDEFEALVNNLNENDNPVLVILE
jgi:hypothetical protein